jgi:hypothetical protein
MHFNLTRIGSLDDTDIVGLTGYSSFGALSKRDDILTCVGDYRRGLIGNWIN